MKTLILLLIFFCYTFAQNLTNTYSSISDFQVNIERDLNQFNPAVSNLINGNYAITWVEGSCIYAQRYSNNSKPIEHNFRVNENIVEHVWPQPSIAMNYIGNFMITWPSDSNVYAQLYSNNGSPIGQNFIVNNNANYGWDPSISSDGEGNFIICWIHYNGFYKSDFFAQWYSKDGIALGNIFRIEIDENSENPSFSVDWNGNIIATWTNSPDNDTFYAQKFSKDGVTIGERITLISDNISGHGISIAQNGNYIITWWNAHINVCYAQIFSSDGTAIGNKFKINSAENARYPSVSISENGNFIITWSEWIELTDKNSTNIYAQEYLKNGAKVGDHFLVNSKPENEFSWFTSKPYVSCDRNGSFVISWMGVRDNNPNIFVRQYSSEGIALDSNIIVNDDEKNISNSSPSIAVDNNEYFAIAWAEECNQTSDIKFKIYDNLGKAFCETIRVNDDFNNTNQKEPKIAKNGNGHYVICWSDQRDNRSDIYAQLFTHNGIPIDHNIKVNDNSASSWNKSPQISMNSSGDFVITWTYIHNGVTDIAAQPFVSDGAKIGSNIIVNDKLPKADNACASVYMNENGNFIIVWVVEQYGNNNVYLSAQKYTPNGKREGENITVNENESSIPWYATPSISGNTSGKYVITWIDERNDANGDVYAQMFSSDGMKIETNFKVNTDNESAFQRYPSIYMEEDGRFIISWTDLRNYNSRIYAQRFLNDGEKHEDNFLITNIRKGDQNFPEVKLFNTKIYSTWTENRDDETNYDIWANVLDWENPTDVDKNQPTPKIFTLDQNYPNPFNPTTTIKYSIPTDLRYEIQDVRLIVYDILGREVITLVNQKQKPGNYEVLWEANNQPSGVYFYQLTAGDFTETRKMILLR